MQIILASAKIMRDFPGISGFISTQPRFGDEAAAFAGELAGWTVEELADAFGCSTSIAKLNQERYRVFGSQEAELSPAIFAYHGQAYKHLKAETLTAPDLEWACSHLWISSCMYGLLRPSDLINQYRMDGSLSLRSSGGIRVSEFWKSRLTDVLIDSVISDDGILVYLDTEEYRALFDWKRVLDTIRVIEPSFHVVKNGKLTTPAVWAKTCRGAMARFIIDKRLTDCIGLYDFGENGFCFDPGLSSSMRPVFVRH